MARCNLSENLPTTTETMTLKSSVYLLGMASHVFNFSSIICSHLTDLLSSSLKNKQIPSKKYFIFSYILGNGVS